MRFPGMGRRASRGPVGGVDCGLPRRRRLRSDRAPIVPTTGRPAHREGNPNGHHDSGRGSRPDKHQRPLGAPPPMPTAAGTGTTPATGTTATVVVTGAVTRSGPVAGTGADSGCGVLAVAPGGVRVEGQGEWFVVAIAACVRGITRTGGGTRIQVRSLRGGRVRRGLGAGRVVMA